MPNYDRRCPTCSLVVLDCYEAITAPEVRCVVCNSLTERVWLPGTGASVIDDSIPGGLEIKNGLCNADGSPRKYYHKSEIRKEAEKRGLVNHVEHLPDHKGGDSSKHTSRWV